MGSGWPSPFPFTFWSWYVLCCIVLSSNKSFLCGVWVCMVMCSPGDGQRWYGLHYCMLACEVKNALDDSEHTFHQKFHQTVLFLWKICFTVMVICLQCKRCYLIEIKRYFYCSQNLAENLCCWKGMCNETHWQMKEYRTCVIWNDTPFESDFHTGRSLVTHNWPNICCCTNVNSCTSHRISA